MLEVNGASEILISFLNSFLYCIIILYITQFLYLKCNKCVHVYYKAKKRKNYNIIYIIIKIIIY